MRDALVLLIVLGSLPIAFYRPFYGLALYAWIAYMRPHDLAWNITLPISMYVAVAILVGLLFAIGRERFMTFGAQSYLLIGLCAWVGLATFMAIRSDLALDRFVQLAKAIVISLVTTGLVRTRKRFSIFLAVMAFSMGGLGLKYGVDGALRGGGRIYQGVGSIVDNNTLAVALAMTVPLLAGVLLVERRKWLRLAAVPLLIACVLAIVFTFSRGGLLTLAIVVVALIIRSGRPLQAGVVVFLCLLGLGLTSTTSFRRQYAERVTSIVEYREDASALDRLEQWSVALRVARDYPAFGVGPANLELVYNIYSPGAGRFLVTHNSFLQMMVDSGIPGFLLFVSLLGVSWWRLGRLGRSNRSWVSTYAHMLQISLVAFGVGGMLLDMAYFEMTFQLIALSLSLEVAARAVTEEDELPEVLDAEQLPWWKRAPA